MRYATSALTDSVAEIATRAAEKILACKEEAIASVVYKADKSPVTLADKAANAFIVDSLTKLIPKIPVVAEESERPAAEHLQSGTYWVVDPLDGTKDFINGTGHYTVNIALIEQRMPSLGVIQVPERGSVYVARLGAGAYCVEDGRRRVLSVRTDALESPTCLVSRFHEGREREMLSEFFPGAMFVAAGSSLKFCMLADGEAHLYMRPFRNHEWDVAAGILLIREAGGVVVGLPHPKEITFGETDLKTAPILSLNSPKWVIPVTKDLR